VRATRRLLLGGAAAGLLRPAAAQGLPPDRFFLPDDAAIADAFGRVAFGGDAQTGAPDRDALLRFRAPMLVRLSGEDAQAFAPAVARHAAELSALTGQRIALAPQGRANVLLVLSPDPVAAIRGAEVQGVLRRLGAAEAVERAMAGPAGDGFGWFIPGIATDGSSEIVFGLVAIATSNDAATVRAAIVEELAQLLGLFGDDDGLAFSIFNDSSPWLDLTGLDRWLPRLLYHPSIRPGMGRRQAVAAARAAMPALRRAAAGPADAEVVEGLLRFAFAGGRTRLTRWEGAMRIAVEGAGAARYRGWMALHAAHLAWLTRHAIHPVAPGEAANVVVVIDGDLGAAAGRLGLRLEAPPPPGLATRAVAFADAARERPEAAVVLLRPGLQPPSVWAAMVAETAALLGLFRPVAGVAPSILDAALPALDLTPLDQRMLRLLYHPEVAAGMAADRLRPVLAGAVASVRIDR
jgi:hypothetical protein